jgi:hypothetical protein
MQDVKASRDVTARSLIKERQSAHSQHDHLAQVMEECSGNLTHHRNSRQIGVSGLRGSVWSLDLRRSHDKSESRKMERAKVKDLQIYLVIESKKRQARQAWQASPDEASPAENPESN